MHPEVASAMAHARHQDLRWSVGPHRLWNARSFSRTRRDRRLVRRPHPPLVSHRTRPTSRRRYATLRWM